MQVLLLIAQDHPMKEIAGALSLTYDTIDSHWLSLRKRIGVETYVGAVLWAIQHGIIDIYGKPLARACGGSCRHD